RRAEVLAPGDEDIRKNIEIVRSRAKDQIQSAKRTKFVSSLLYLHERTTLSQGLSLFALLYLIAMALFHLRLVRPGKWFLRFACVFMVAALAMGYSQMTRLMTYGEVTAGVILPEEVDVFSGPSDHSYSVFFKLHSATEVEVTEVKNGWVKIEVDGKKGYVPANQIGLL
ncbi:MAG: hypothetical protein KUG81_03565, partial [Gammaproteobacteria bacterium]|nr:hypothetical protein [Gammaproteobacteria bacterium]